MQNIKKVLTNRVSCVKLILKLVVTNLVVENFTYNFTPFEKPIQGISPYRFFSYCQKSPYTKSAVMVFHTILIYNCGKYILTRFKIFCNNCKAVICISRIYFHLLAASYFSCILNNNSFIFKSFL